MGRFITGRDVEIIHHESWDENEEVTIKKWTIREKDKLDSQILRIAGVAGDIPEVVIKSVTIPYLLAGIESWTFCDDEGKRVPVNEHWIGKLDEETADFIAGEIRRLNEGRTEEEQREFFRSVAGGDENGGEAAAEHDSDSGDGGDGVEL